MKVLHAMLLLLVVSSSWADYKEGLEVQCDQYQMRVRDFDLVDGKPGQMQNAGAVVYYDHKPHKASCVVNKHKVEVDFQVVGGSKCSAGSLVTLRIDSQVIVDRAEIHGCPTGLREIGVMPGGRDSYDLEICGYTALDQRPTFNGCVTVTAKQLESIKKPLDRLFPVGDLIKLVKFPN